jgi:apolipoprotein N-acyltransferase
VVLPLVGAWWLRRSARATLELDAEVLSIRSRTQLVEVPLASIAALRTWRVPWPGPGIDLVLRSGRRLAFGLSMPDPVALQRRLSRAGLLADWTDARSGVRADDASARAAAAWPRLDHALVKFGLFPLLLALPAFRLHQNIAFGGTFGEAYTFGLSAWFTGLLIWWAAWSAGMMLFAAALRVPAELVAQAALRVAPALAGPVRAAVTAVVRLLYYVGVPAWFALRLALG